MSKILDAIDSTLDKCSRATFKGEGPFKKFTCEEVHSIRNVVLSLHDYIRVNKNPNLPHLKKAIRKLNHDYEVVLDRFWFFSSFPLNKTIIKYIETALKDLK